MIEEFLNELKELIEKDKTLYSSIESGEKFEKHVISEMEELAKDRGFEIFHNGKHSFPDVTIIFSPTEIYGVEIKFSASGNWKSKGNSVFESLSSKEEDSYKEIYILFGRKPKPKEDKDTIEIKIAPYGTSIDKLEVTHSPRFSINMNDAEFDLSDLFGSTENYAEFRIKTNEEKIKLLQEYFKTSAKKDSTSKWYLPSEAEIESNVYNSQPILFSSLDSNIKQKIIAESFILFPYDLLNSSANYKNVALNMINEYFVYTSSLRDHFTANGRAQFDFNNTYEYPKILKTFFDHSPIINDILENSSINGIEDKCYAMWKEAFPSELFDVIESSEEKNIGKIYKNIIENLSPEFCVKNLETEKDEKIKVDLTPFYNV